MTYLSSLSIQILMTQLSFMSVLLTLMIINYLPYGYVQLNLMTMTVLRVYPIELSDKDLSIISILLNLMTMTYLSSRSVLLNLVTMFLSCKRSASGRLKSIVSWQPGSLVGIKSSSISIVLILLRIQI